MRGLISGSGGTLGFSLPWRQPGCRRQVGPRLRRVGLSKKCPPPPPASSQLFLLIPVRTRGEGGDGATEPGTPPHWAPPLRIRRWLVFSEPGPLAMHQQPTFQLVRRATPSPGASPAGLLPRSRGPASQRLGGGPRQPLLGPLRTQCGEGSWGQTPQTRRMWAWGRGC